ncbi:recombinase family protein [Billgrantia endophytica]|uniref:Resolvase/invertase-type recombinase catalytic domain-containing protein n=1 Tax=Billgrantia endophytica TaxID=2033802 RepID=A0A2N7TUJ3_9GAMM|nr:recombinase family protein [Halomonas endophytica]PMR71818.1 hypothetical protein C1H69_23065 [Halomonas endophytica]
MSNKPRAYLYIRWSSLKQNNGDSRRRQEMGVKEFTERTGVDITQTFTDEAMSSHHGQNAKEGDLKKILDMVENGIIRSGDFIVSENVDRISRQGVLDTTLDIVGKILRAGVRLYTTNDHKIYDYNGVGEGIGDWLTLQILMERAYQESKLKSDRLKAVWNHKRETVLEKKAKGKFLTSAVPVWLEVRKDENGNQYFHVKEDIVADIKTLLELLKTRGYRASLRVFNEKYRKSDFHFREVYLSKLLTDGRLYGNLTLKEIYHGADSKKKHRILEVIENYYPKVVDFGVVEEARLAVKNRDFTMSGQYVSGSIENIFKHILKCGACGGALSIKTNTKYYKGKPHKVYYYLECKNHRIGSCFQRNINLSAFENAFIQYFELFKMEHILNESLDTEVLETEKQFYDIKEEYFKINNEQNSIEAMFENYVSQGVDIPESFKDKSIDVGKRLQVKKKEMETIEGDLAFKKQQSQKKYSLEDVKGALEDSEKRLALNHYLKAQKIKIYTRVIGDLVFVVFDNIKSNPFYQYYEDIDEVILSGHDNFAVSHAKFFIKNQEIDAFKEELDDAPDLDKEFERLQYEHKITKKFVSNVVDHYKAQLKKCKQVVYIYNKEINKNTDEYKERLGRLFKDPLFEAQRYYIEFLENFDERTGCDNLIEIKKKLDSVNIYSICDQVYKEMEAEIQSYHQELSDTTTS